MPFFSPENLSLWTNLAIFVVAGLLIWFAGVRLEAFADATSQRTGMGHAFVGVLMLATVTSLPEVAATVSGSVIGNPALVVHNLTGAVITQMAILSISGWFVRGTVTLTYFSPDFLLLFEGVGVVTVLLVAIAGMAAGPTNILPNIDIWPALVFLTYVMFIYLTYRFQFSPRWAPVQNARPQAVREHEEQPLRFPGKSLRYILTGFAASAVLVFLGGWTAAQAADALAVQTGLGSNFVGVTLLAFTTGLPEFSTTIAAVRRRNYSLAIANILGTNAFNISLLFLAEITFRGGSVLHYAQNSAIFTAALGAIMVCIYLWGMLEREDRSILGLGWDSALVVGIYIGGLIVIYRIGHPG